MDAVPPLVALMVAALPLAAAAHAVRDRPAVLWSGAWAAVLGSGALLLTDPEVLGPRSVVVLGPLASGAQLAGALALARGRAPAWDVPAALLLGLARAGPAGALPAGLETWVSLVVEPGASLAAAIVVLRVVRRDAVAPLSLALVPPLLTGLALLDAITAASRHFGDGLGGPLVASWFALAAVGIPLQLHAAAEGGARQKRRRTEVSLLESQERFRALTENAFDLVAELDADERFTYVNPRYEDVLGHPPQALLGHLPRDFLHPDDLPAAAAFAAEAAERGTAFGLVLRARHRDGHWVWLECAARSFQLPGGERRWVMSSRDVSERRQVEETRERVRERLEETVTARTQALQASEARFRALADHAPELISEFDDRGRYLFANGAFRDLLGREPWDLIGTNPEALIHPDDLGRSRRSMTRAIRREGTAHAVHRLRHADGTWRWFDNTGRAYRTSEGELRFVSIGRDVTDIRRAEGERRRLEAHMQEVQRLESLGVLAGGIAHDFNNLLAVILGNVALLEAGGGDGPDSSRLRRIGAAARHAQGLTEQMLTYAGRSVGKLLPLDLSALVRETEDLLRAAVAKPVCLALELAEDLPLVAADATQLRQVLLNLVGNASEALGEEGGAIRVRTHLRRADPAWIANAFGSADRHAGPWVALEVADDGPGIAEPVRRRIFEPFYSTKRAGRGLGLAAVLGIASAHRGLVVLESTPGEGTCFHLLIPPEGEARRAEEPRAAQSLRPPVGTATVLVVDDEDAVREVAQVFLERAGFRVVPASGGREAVARLASDPSIDVVVLDLAMPDLSGAETLRLLRETRPDIPAVVTSGYGRDLAAERLGDSAGFAFVAKPYDPDTLTAALVEALRGTDPPAAREPSLH